MVCWRTGRISAMVVWAQCCRLLSYYALPRPDVLLYAESCQQAGVLLQAFHYSLLGIDIPVFLGRPSPFVIHITSYLGAIARYCFFIRSYCPMLGMYDQGIASPWRRMG